MENKTTYCVPGKFCALWVGKVGNDGTYVFGVIQDYGGSPRFEYFKNPEFFMFFNSEAEARNFILEKRPDDKDFEIIKSERVQISPYKDVCYIIHE